MMSSIDSTIPPERNEFRSISPSHRIIRFGAYEVRLLLYDRNNALRIRRLIGHFESMLSISYNRNLLKNRKLQEMLY